jgi:hypothetical protein
MKKAVEIISQAPFLYNGAAVRFWHITLYMRSGERLKETQKSCSIPL